MNTFPKYALAECERRWRVDPRRTEWVASLPFREIDDLYLRGTRLRLRRVRSAEGVVFKLGKKYGKAPDGAEPITNIYLTEAEYAALSQLPGYAVSKRRYAVGEGALDIYQGPVPAAIFEREFASAADAAACAAPPFAIEEVTDMPEYCGFALAVAATQRR
ncbi:hypothetical protein [Fulvimonas yonginensis]|uniref:CYTH domain-containing protein n=1 Tax=Fulvimonas yonginensis TaxID=1495200 RepID=A0ABU8JCC8_9GAMM